MSDIAEILKSVPEVKLAIIPLTWELIGEDGHIDPIKATYKVTEIDTAIKEAEAYAESVQMATHLLKQLVK